MTDLLGKVLTEISNLKNIANKLIPENNENWALNKKCNISDELHDNGCEKEPIRECSTLEGNKKAKSNQVMERQQQSTETKTDRTCHDQGDSQENGPPENTKRNLTNNTGQDTTKVGPTQTVATSYMNCIIYNHGSEVFADCESAYFVSDTKCSWILDSGCSVHMTGDRNILQDVHKCKHVPVKFGSGDIMTGIEKE